jgi:hypothetical protein
VRVQYTNPGKPEGKRSSPKITTRPIHKVAVVVPVEYVFEYDTCDNEIGSRGPRRDLKTKEEIEAARASRKNSAKVKEGEPYRGRAARSPQETRETPEVGEASGS